MTARAAQNAAALPVTAFAYLADGYTTPGDFLKSKEVYVQAFVMCIGHLF